MNRGKGQLGTLTPMALAAMAQLKDKTYRAPVIRKVEIPKAGGGTRSLGITTFEDKIAQRAVKMTLEPMYEQLFYGFSMGSGPNAQRTTRWST